MVVISGLAQFRWWRNIVKTHYGDNPNHFLDARTIRIHLQDLVKGIQEELEVRISLAPHPNELADWVSHSEPELIEARAAVQTSLDWLHAKGLKP